jgi:hypothetical protein
MGWAGWLGDKTTLWLAKRRGGIHLPEDSLISLIVPTIVSGVGIVVYALSSNSPNKYSSWGIIMGKSHFVLAIFGVRCLLTICEGWTLQQFGFIVCLITTTHFAAEAYPSNPGPALVLVVGMKNIVSFGEDRTGRYATGNIEANCSTGASFGIVPMVHTWDYLTAYMVVS